MTAEYDLKFGDKELVSTAKGKYYVSEASPTEAFWNAWKQDKTGMYERGYSIRKLENSPWKVKRWEKATITSPLQSKPKLDPWDDLTPNRRLIDGKPIYQNQF